MKKNRKKEERPAVIVTLPVLPLWVVFMVTAAWGVYVLQRYIAVFPLGDGGALLSVPGPVEAGALARRLGENLLHIGVALAVLLSAAGAGYAVAGRWLSSVTGAGERAFFAAATGVGLCATAVFLTGLCGLLYPVPWGLLVAGFAVYGWYALRSSGLPAVTGRSSSAFEKLACAAIAAIALMNLLGACCPELFYDAQYYQLGIPLKWIRDHRIVATVFNTPSFFPFNVNMIYLLAHMLGSDITAKLMHFVFGLTVCAGIYQFGKRYFSRDVGVLAALIFYAVPQVMVVSWKAAIELGIALFEFGAVAALMQYMAVKERRWLVLAGILCGFSVGSKYSSLAFGFLPAVIMLAVAGLKRREGLRPTATAVLIFCGAALIAAMPWYLRNLIISGNPVFPFLWQHLGSLQLKMTRSLFADPPHPAFSVLNYFGFLWPLTMGSLQQESFLGPLFLMCVPLLFLFRKIDARIKILMVYVGAAVVFWAVLGRFYLRYFVPTLPVISVIFAYYLTAHGSKPLRNAAFALVIGISAMNAVYSSQILQVMHAPLPYVAGSESREEYLSLAKMGYPNPCYPAIAYANAHLPADAVILFLGETRGLFSERRFLVSGVAEFSPLVEWVRQSRTPDDLYRLCRANGITHILLNVPEARRLKGYDIFYWDAAGLRVWREFWRTRVREIHRALPDLSIPQRGIYSLKRQNPAMWERYAADPGNYVYLFEILSPAAAGAPHPVPIDFFGEQSLYSQSQWDLLSARSSAMKGTS